MASRYTGPVDLIDGSGNLLESGVAADLSSRRERRGGLMTWTGKLGPVTDDAADWTSVTTIRLPDGREGSVIPADVNITSDRAGMRKSAGLKGSGPAPF